MGNTFKLSEAAAEILNRSVAAGHKDSPSKLPASVAYGTKDAGAINQDEGGLDATKGSPTATPPGATPPVGSEPMKKLKDQPGSGKEDMTKDSSFDDAGDSQEIAARKKSTLAPQKMEKNPGATFQSYGEETEMEDEFKLDLSEDINALLEGENLSEEFVQKATTIFEAAVTTRLKMMAEELADEMEKQFESELEQLQEEFATKIDDYLNYIVEEWMKENQLAVESGLRAELVNDFISGLRNLFTEHYIDVPEEKVDVIEELAGKVESLEDSLNEQIQKNIELTKLINEHKKSEIVHAVCEGLSQTQVEKLKTLAESVEFTTEEEFSKKVSTLKEAYTTKPVVAEKSALEEGVDVEEDKDERKSSDPFVNAVAKTISKKSPLV